LSLRLSRSCLLLPLLFLFFASPALRAVDSAKKLSPQYRHWIEEEVPYIIQSEERKQFFSLHSDAERDNFIKSFWDARNPHPGSDANEFREEHLRRLAYANQNFGNVKAQDGWRTDQGHIYIVLGPPEQRANYPAPRNVRPMTIWFYESKTPALPSHFYIIFYKRSIGEDFTLYSPYQDGPSRLVTGLEGLNDQKNNLDIIRKALGDEVARTTISLIPSEPVDLKDYSPSMQSDILLSTIKGLADNPLNKSIINERRLNEHVTTNVFLEPNSAVLQTAVFRDATGRMTVHYLFSYDHPQPTILGPLPDKRLGYSLTLQSCVLTPDGKSVYEQDEKIAAVVNDDQAASARAKRFGAESRVPLAPGQYLLVATLTNDLNHLAVRQRAQITVPDPAQTAWGVSKVLVFSPQPPIHDSNGSLPFSLAGLRFVPKSVQQTTLHVGEPLRVLFQLWTKPADPASREGHKVKVHYVYGALQAGKELNQQDEEIDATSFDASGTLLTGRTLSTEGLSIGNYRVVIAATDETTLQKAYASVNFRITSDVEVTDMWTAYVALQGARGNAIDDYKRALSALMQEQNDNAISWLQGSLADDPTYNLAFGKLVDLLSQGNKYKEVAELSAKHPVTEELNQQTAILMSQANVKIGDLPSATRILEQKLQLQPSSAALSLALADVYQKQGNTSKAEDYKRQAAKLPN
jgi:GWxTD domain-containing protein